MNEEEHKETRCNRGSCGKRAEPVCLPRDPIHPSCPVLIGDGWRKGLSEVVPFFDSRPSILNLKRVHSCLLKARYGATPSLSSEVNRGNELGVEVGACSLSPLAVPSLLSPHSWRCYLWLYAGMPHHNGHQLYWCCVVSSFCINYPKITICVFLTSVCDWELFVTI